MLPTPASTLDLPVILDDIDVEIPSLKGLDVLDGNNPHIDNATNHLWGRMIINK